ncbi:4092_t:CDS:2 [Acaulospora colombiana]|uniref:4092_t:CDS:1 n=1 Tax=Acaulospora colombiana TaxID=27376 RepID=A0ACA9MKD0_9GLOM|nr:4092_t:CDS:2 [Acaulospora colombiana]
MLKASQFFRNSSGNAFFQKNPSIPTSIIAKRNQEVSRLGFGSYRINWSDEGHQRAIQHAIQSGINVIDSSAHFEAGESEEVIGKVLERMFKNGSVSREAGYVEATDVTSLDNSFAKINNKSAHSISPDFLRDQINLSLSRLQLKKLDIFMINNPERMLRARNRQYSIDDLYRDMEQSFHYLDTESVITNCNWTGRIGGYGVCSNTMAIPTASDHISLPAILEKLSKPSRQNFVAIQVPFNLFERDVIRKGVGRQCSLAQYAEVKELDARLDPWLTEEIQRTIQLSENYFAAKYYLRKQVNPNVRNDLESLSSLIETTEITEEKGRDRLRDWIIKYHVEIQEISKLIISYAYGNLININDELDSILSIISPSLHLDDDQSPSFHGEQLPHSPLSIKALRIILANSSVGCTLVGMRSMDYVNDSILSLKLSDGDLIAESLDEIYNCPSLQQ